METVDTQEITPEFLPEDYLVAGRYQIDRLLGTGGMGCVYLAKDRVLGEELVAIKVLHRQLAFDDRYTQRFLREVQLMRRVNHKNVVRTYDVAANGDLVYFTMEYVPGKQLLDVMEAHELNFDEKVEVVNQICDGLSAIHNAGIVHRDLKPENIILTNDGIAKITDFGVARPEVSKLTAHNEVIGSATYMAPEVWLGEGITSSVDIYALGVIFYELFTEQIPFEGETPAVLMRQHLDRAPTPPSTVDGSIPFWLNRLILRMLGKTPGHRPRSPVEIIDYISSVTAKYSAEDIEKEKQHAQMSSAFLETLEEKTAKTEPTGENQILSNATTQIKSRIFKPRTARLISNLTKHQDVSNTYLHKVRAVCIWACIMVVIAGVFAFGISIIAFIDGYQISTTQTETTSIYSVQKEIAGFTPDSIAHAISAGALTAIVVVLSLSIPGTLIAAASGALFHLVWSTMWFAVFYAATGFTLLVYYWWPQFSELNFDVPSFIQAAGAAKQNLIEVAQLHPYMTNYETTIVAGESMLLNATGTAPITSLPLMMIVYIGAISIVSIVARRSVSWNTERPELSYFLVGFGLFLILALETSMPFYQNASFSELVLIGMTFKLPIPVYLTTITNWMFVYICVGYLIPKIGGAKLSYKL